MDQRQILQMQMLPLVWLLPEATLVMPLLER